LFQTLFYDFLRIPCVELGAGQTTTQGMVVYTVKTRFHEGGHRVQSRWPVVDSLACASNMHVGTSLSKIRRFDRSGALL
jgi:hypothetical protein